MATDRQQAGPAAGQAVPRAAAPGPPIARPAPATGQGTAPTGQAVAGQAAISQAATGQTAPAAEQSPHLSVSRRLARNPVVGFIPWILFWVIGGPSTWETAAIAALLAALIIMVLNLDPGPSASGPAAAGEQAGRYRLDFSKIKLLDVATVIFFAGFVVAALVTSRPDVAALDRYSQALSSGALGLIALGSIVFGHPFTIDYAKQTTSPEYWQTPLFKRINLVLSAVWAGVFLLCGVLGVLSVHAGSKGMRDWLNWYLPIILLFVGFRLNQWYPDRAVARFRQQFAEGDAPDA
jgi:hypothetical protein